MNRAWFFHVDHTQPRCERDMARIIQIVFATFLCLCLVSKSATQKPRRTTTIATVETTFEEVNETLLEETTEHYDLITDVNDSFSETNETDKESENLLNYYDYLPKISYGCPVNHSRPCVPKCCYINETISEKNCTWSDNTDFFPVFTDCQDSGIGPDVPIEDRYEYFIGNPCTTGRYKLDPDNFPDDKYLLYSNGSLFYANQYLSMADYCMDMLDGKIAIFVCFESGSEPPVQFQHILYPIGLLLSIPFLLATALTYSVIEQFRDLQGKSLTCHVLCLAIAYFFLAFVQLTGRDLGQDMCVATAFLIQFFFVACFLWLNVLAYDTYRNIHDDFRSMYNRGSLRSERKKFLVYSLYSWNGAFILLIVSLVMDLQPDIPDFHIKPHFGARSCWFNSDTAALPYFYGPIGLLIAINLIFFVLSSYHIIKEKKDAAARALRRSNNSDIDQQPRKRSQIYIDAFKQCLALFIIMGLNWTAEIISWAAGGPDIIWLTTDVFNTLQGILIFYIYVIRPKRVRTVVADKCQQLWQRMCHKTKENPTNSNVNASHEFLPRHSNQHTIFQGRESNF